MIDFLTKSTLSLFVLLAVYHLVLEKEKMHQFNRFYLLFSIVFSFAIPFITIEVITKTIEPIQQTYTYVVQENIKVPEIKETIDYTPIILWSLYSLITLILLFRYFRNILKIVSNIKSNQITEYKNAKLVLLEEQTPPHTFLNYIFLNKADYQNRKINKQLYAHELIHVNQKHTLDVLLIEAVKSFFWFNPIFIFYKKAIQLNHEFLADEKVVNAYKDVSFYQKLLLAHAIANPTFELTSNLNYSVTKKRFTMMTKTTSESMAALKKLLLLPLFSGLIFFMCVESVAQEKSSPTPSGSSPKKTTQTDLSIDKQRDAYYAGVRIIVNDCNKKTIIDKKYEELTLAEKKRFLGYIPSPKLKKKPTEKEFESWKNEKDFAIWLDGKNIPNSELNQYTTKDIAYFGGSFVYKNARTKKHPQLHQFSLYTHAYYDKNLKDSHLKFSGKELRITTNQNDKIKSINIISDKKDKAQPVVKNDNNVSPNYYNLSQVSEKPTFPDGMQKFFQFIGKNYQVPEVPNLKGKVYISFIVEKDGSLSDIRPLRDLGFGTGDEAIRVLKLSQKWIPGKIDGEPVRVIYSLPIYIESAG